MATCWLPLLSRLAPRCLLLFTALLVSTALLLSTACCSLLPAALYRPAAFLLSTALLRAACLLHMWCSFSRVTLHDPLCRFVASGEHVVTGEGQRGAGEKGEAEAILKG